MQMEVTFKAFKDCPMVRDHLIDESQKNERLKSPFIDISFKS